MVTFDRQLSEMVKARIAEGLTWISGKKVEKISVEANTTMAIILQNINVSNQHVHLNLTQCDTLTIFWFLKWKNKV